MATTWNWQHKHKCIAHVGHSTCVASSPGSPPQVSNNCVTFDRTRNLKFAGSKITMLLLRVRLRSLGTRLAHVYTGKIDNRPTYHMTATRAI